MRHVLLYSNLKTGLPLGLELEEQHAMILSLQSWFVRNFVAALPQVCV